MENMAERLDVFAVYLLVFKNNNKVELDIVYS